MVAGDLDTRVAGEDQIGPARSEFTTAARRAGLDEHRPSLWAARHRQRPAHREELADMIQLVHLVRVGVDAVDPVVQHGVVFPGVPQPDGGLKEFLGAIVAGVMAQMRFQAEVLRLAVVDRGDDVPRRAATGQVVEGGEGTGHVERRVVGGGTGRAEADVRGRLRQYAQDDGKVQLHRPRAVLDGVGDRAAVDARHG